MRKENQTLKDKIQKLEKQNSEVEKRSKKNISGLIKYTQKLEKQNSQIVKQYEKLANISNMDIRKYNSLLAKFKKVKFQKSQIWQQLQKHISNNTVTVGNLMFQDNYRPRGKATFGNVIRYCNNLQLVGFYNWRTPTRQEMVTAFFHRKSFRYMKDSWHWTSTKYNKKKAFIIDLEDSEIQNDDIDDKHYGICVRSK